MRTKRQETIGENTRGQSKMVNGRKKRKKQLEKTQEAKAKWLMHAKR